MAINTHPQDSATAWDCDPYVIFPDESYDLELDETEDETDWQVLVLDRFGDRLVNGE